MAIRVVRLGEPRAPGEGVRLGTVRRPPRGVPKSEFARRDFYDVWLPELAPSAPTVSSALAEPWTEARWKRFVRAYRKEMGAPGPRHLLSALAALSAHSHFSVGCYCENAARCHRSVLAELLAEAGATLMPNEG